MNDLYTLVMLVAAIVFFAVDQVIRHRRVGRLLNELRAREYTDHARRLDHIADMSARAGDDKTQKEAAAMAARDRAFAAKLRSTHKPLRGHYPEEP